MVKLLKVLEPLIVCVDEPLKLTVPLRALKVAPLFDQLPKILILVPAVNVPAVKVALALILKVAGAVKFLPGVLGVLKFLKAEGYKLAIASNRPTKFTRIILKTLGILKMFDMVLCADKSPRPKPYPDMLWMIAKCFKKDKSEIL